MQRFRIMVCVAALAAGGCALGEGVPAVQTPPTAPSPAAASTPSNSPASPEPIVASTTTTTTSPATTATLEDRTEELRAVAANEAGRIMVLEYHLIGEPEDTYTRSAANFRRDVERLIAGGYYPITVRDLARGHIDVPAAKTPVVLTFDDSSSGQCRILADGTPDPESACGMLLEAARRHPGDWAPSATFNVLLDVDVDDRVLFGQPDIVEEKLTRMVGWGMEIGSHTISHFDLSAGTPEQLRWQLGVPEAFIEDLIPGYEVDTLATPFGIYPEDEALLVAGEWEGRPYDYLAVLEVSGGPVPSPHSAEFDPIHITRIIVTQESIDGWLSYFEANPDDRYVSDGDASTVAVPAGIDFEVRADLPDRVRVIRYRS